MARENRRWYALTIYSPKKCGTDFLGGKVESQDAPRWLAPEDPNFKLFTLALAAIREAQEESGLPLEGTLVPVGITNETDCEYGMFFLIVDSFIDNIPGSKEGTVRKVPLKKLITGEIPLREKSAKLLEEFLKKIGAIPEPNQSKHHQTGSLILRS